MSTLTTHVLDTACGQPARGLFVELAIHDPNGGAWRRLGGGLTDDDGRLRTLLSPGEPLCAATYRLTFATGPYFAGRGVETFFPEVTVVFAVSEPARPHHVPLLVSPFGYSTYRGS
jgi:5-hydroxyisourate hydrolase